MILHLILPLQVSQSHPHDDVKITIRLLLTEAGDLFCFLFSLNQFCTKKWKNYKAAVYTVHSYWAQRKRRPCWYWKKNESLCVRICKMFPCRGTLIWGTSVCSPLLVELKRFIFTWELGKKGTVELWYYWKKCNCLSFSFLYKILREHTIFYKESEANNRWDRDTK